MKNTMKCIALLLASVFLINADYEASTGDDFYSKGLDLYNQEKYEEAFSMYLKSAESDNIYAIYSLGYMSYYGLGTTKNFRNAFYWYSKAAQLGSPQAQFNIGQMYYFGEGVEINKTKAMEWFRLAAELGHENARKNLILLQQKTKLPYYVYIVFFLVLFGIPMVVGVHKGGSKINWFFMGLLFPYSWMAAFAKHPIGILKYIIRDATEDDCVKRRYIITSKAITINILINAVSGVVMATMTVMYFFKLFNEDIQRFFAFTYEKPEYLVWFWSILLWVIQFKYIIPKKPNET